VGIFFLFMDFAMGTWILQLRNIIDDFQTDIQINKVFAMASDIYEEVVIFLTFLHQLNVL
jgi:hypothetical protein